MTRTPKIRSVPLVRVRPDPDQPRKFFSKIDLEDMAASLREQGQVQPALVRSDRELGKGWFMLIAGERRWRGLQLNQADSIQVIVRDDLAPADVTIIQLIENLQRADMTPMEEAHAFKREVDKGLSIEELATKLGIKQPWRISDRLRLFNLAPDLLHLFETGNLSPEAVYELSRLKSHEDQHRITKMINRGQVKGYNAIRAAVMAIVDDVSQADIFGDAKKATAAELRTVAGMEEKIAAVARMVNGGFLDNQVVIARRIAPDRARLMADKLGLIRTHCLQMENQLRRAAAQALLFQAERA